MRRALIKFYTSFFGHEFARDFRRPADYKISRIRFTATTPKQLYKYVHGNSGIHPCYASIYNYSSIDLLKKNNQNNIYFDRTYFDFDVADENLHKIKKNYCDLRSEGPNNNVSKQKRLKRKLKDYVINKKIAKPAIDEGKQFAYEFNETFGKYPALFFSGFKGCHAYCFFKPTPLINPNRTVEDISKNIKELYKLETMDLSVNKNASSRVARIPYSKHHITGLTVVPFKISDNYDEIISKSLKPEIEPFNIEDHITKFNEHLKRIDQILEDNHKIALEQTNRQIKQSKTIYRASKGIDHRKFFEKILGEPVREYPDKEYVMYCCPFKDHQDSKPSFRVHRTGYNCYGCGKYGNYWQFIKDYYGWDDEKVRHFLRSKIP